jgi:hypothetical protein
MAITQLMSLRPMVHKQPRSITSTCSLSMLARATTRMILAAKRGVVRPGF